MLMNAPGLNTSASYGTIILGFLRELANLDCIIVFTTSGGTLF
jgi:hypothetical protein